MIVVATLYEAVGGSSKVLMRAAEALRTEHEVIRRAPLADADSRMALPLSALTLDTWGRKLAALPVLIRLFFREYAFVGKTRPDFIYVHDEPSLYVYGLIGRLRGVAVVWHVHMREGHGLRRIVRNALCDAKIFVSKFIVAGEQQKPCAVIANPVSIGPVVHKSRKSDELVIGLLGSISRLKNQELGLRALARLRQQGLAARIAIYGNILEEDYKTYLTKLTAELELGDVVEFRNFAPVEHALAEIDVLLACSSYESFGLAVAEALVAGVPVVATDIVAHREFAGEAQTTALTICAPEADAMAAAVLQARPDAAFSTQVRQTFSGDKFDTAVVAFFRKLVE